MYVCIYYVDNVYLVCLCIHVHFSVCVHVDLWPVCGELTSAMCCLVFVVRLEYAQALGLSVCRCGLAAGPKAWLRPQG